MKKKLYAYFNDNDLYDLLAFLNTRNISILTPNHIPQSDIRAISTERLILQIPAYETHNIEIVMCSYGGYFLQPGVIGINEEYSTQEMRIFTAIKKYIRQNYKLSKDKSYYIGPGIYSDWLQRKHRLPVLFEYDEIIVQEQDVEEVFAYIENKGFVIRANNTRLRNISNWNLNEDSLVICDNINKLNNLIIRNTIIHYDYNSICIFVYKNVKRKQYRFVMDKRIDLSSNIMLFELYNDICEKSGQSTTRSI